MISASFLSRQAEAIRAQSRVSHELVLAGLDVTHYGLRIAKTRKEFAEYRMGHDMMVHVGEYSIPIEVKGSNKSWTGLADYPSAKPLVCSQATADKKGMVSSGVLWIAHVLVSNPTGAMLVIPAGTKVTEHVPWKDPSRNEFYEVLVCTRADLRPMGYLVEQLRRFEDGEEDKGGAKSYKRPDGNGEGGVCG